MDRRTFLLTPLALARAAHRRPNVVLISAFGWRGIATPWAGDLDLDAPNLGRLGKDGVVFTRAYGYPFNENESRRQEDSVDKAFEMAGYAVQASGDATSFIQEHAAEPFFLREGVSALSGVATHAPANIHPRGNIPTAQLAEARRVLAGFYDTCSTSDRRIGEVLETLDRLHLADDTIVVFNSDQGLMLGSHGSFDDGEPFEESSRIPFVIRYARTLKPAAHGLASGIDIVPTLCALCGVEPPEGTKGRNLLGPEPEESVCSRGKLGQSGEWRVLVRGYDKLVATPKGEVTHLFNLADDPLELTNLAHDSAQKLKLASLKAQLLAQMKKLGDGYDPSGLRIR